MLRMRTIGKIAGVWVAVGSCVLTLSSRASISAQAESWTPPHPMHLTPERALAMVLATDRKLDYVPGEVLVRFREGVGAAGQQRAMMALRSKPTPSNLRWVGDVAVLSDPTELDATILAAQLNGQPEVASAEPNYLYRTSATPNDPGFSQPQWNMTALDMPRAWGINPGANDSMIVAVVDTGLTAVSRSYLFQTWNGRATQTVGVPFDFNPDFNADRLVVATDFVCL